VESRSLTPKVAFTREGYALLPANCVSNGSSHAEEVVAAEAPGINVVVILNVVVVNFGANEKIVPGVIADSAPEVLHKMMVARVIYATGKITAGGGIGDVKACAVDADAAEQVKPDLLSQLRLIERVEVGKDRPIGLIAKVACLAGPPRGFDHESDSFLEADGVPGDVKISAAFFRDISQSQLTGAGCRRHDRTRAEHYVALLGSGKVAREEKTSKQCEKR
jgi:hypothetical protein